MAKADMIVSSPDLSPADDDEEPLDYGTSSHNEDADEEDGDGDNDSTGWADPPPPSSDKASGSPTREAADASSSLHPQAADIPPSESMPVTTSSLPEEPLSLTIPLKSAGTEIDLGPESAPIVSPKATDTLRTKAAGKMVLTEAEEVQYEKHTRRKLLVDPPAEKLMADAFKSAGGGEEQEPAAVSRPDHTSPHSGGSKFSEKISSHCPLDPEEGGDESLIRDMKASPDISPLPEQIPGASLSSAGTLPMMSPSKGVRSPTGELLADEAANFN
ncbi:uncharacterized protein LOC109823405 [Asparagus officinalis]|uniref:uncharacterized protein LOC109823405 n=1 Tax=Asparagus officinalis TaxID=4686 RepID=UPI00098E70F1|nr:uncharacterized protein LOC109823405 [Asparagus officinalis]